MPQTNWQHLFKELQSETDPDVICLKLVGVEVAMFNRILELGASVPGAGEIEEMKRASEDLLRIKVEILKWPALASNQV